MDDIDIACQALFAGRVNVPTAASMCGLTTDSMKAKFLQYVTSRTGSDWELDITPCWPYA